MINKRIIFALLYQDGYFYLSRNFKLQKVGNLSWLINNFGFGKTSNHIDELICLLVKRKPTKEDKKTFFKDINNLRKKIFIPVTLGGGIRNSKDVSDYFNNGADKILLNTAVFNENLSKEITDEEQLKKHASLIERKKAIALEAPVSGGCHRAATGNISIFVGGSRNGFEKSLPVLKYLGRRILHTGDFGTASVLKVITNYLATVHLVALGEAWTIASKTTLDLDKTFKGIAASS